MVGRSRCWEKTREKIYRRGRGFGKPLFTIHAMINHQPNAVWFLLGLLPGKKANLPSRWPTCIYHSTRHSADLSVFIIQHSHSKSLVLKCQAMPNLVWSHSGPAANGFWCPYPPPKTWTVFYYSGSYCTEYMLSQGPSTRIVCCPGGFAKICHRLFICRAEGMDINGIAQIMAILEAGPPVKLVYAKHTTCTSS